MSSVSHADAAPSAVIAALNYIVDAGEKPVTASNSPGAVRVTSNSGKYEAHAMTIQNARIGGRRFSLEKEGFILVEQETRVKNFYDDQEVRAVYYPEVEKLVREMTGATTVLVFDHTLRAEDDAKREAEKTSAPVRRIHNDYTEWSGPQRVRDLLPPAEAAARLQQRFAVVQVWRPIGQTVKTAPLAIADAQSIDSNDLVPTERRYPDRVGEIYHLSFSANHGWFYFPNMQTNEALVFKCYDSEKDGRSRWTAHSAFEDPSSPAAAPARESIEARTLAFFSPEKAA